jgi:hypothetical protein
LKKLDSLGKDVLSFLEKNEPKMVLWREIKEALYPKYQSHYKDENSFGVALTNKLTQLRAKGLIKKEAEYYGTFKSSIEKEQAKPLEKKKLKESSIFKPEALPVLKHLYEFYGYKWLKPYIEQTEKQQTENL